MESTPPFRLRLCLAADLAVAHRMAHATAAPRRGWRLWIGVLSPRFGQMFETSEKGTVE